MRQHRYEHFLLLLLKAHPGGGPGFPAGNRQYQGEAWCEVNPG
jgi:hypothetical protein